RKLLPYSLTHQYYRPYRSSPTSLLLHPLTSTLFPYTTLFRSSVIEAVVHCLIGFPECQDIVNHHLWRCFFDKNTCHEVCNGFHLDRKSTRLNSSHGSISYAVFCLKKKIKKKYVMSSTHYDLHC